MKVLFLTHRVPYPPNRGDRIRSFHLLKFLAARGEVSLACTSEEPIASDSEQALAAYCRQIEICPTSRIGRNGRAAWSLARGQSATEGYFHHPRLSATISLWARRGKFDVVVCYCSGMYRYTQLPALRDVPVVVDLVDVDSQKWTDCTEHAPLLKRWLYRLESLRIRRLEREIASHAAAVTLVSKEERELFRQISPHASGCVVGNGVDLDYFCRHSDTSEMKPHTCAFVGVLDYPPNVDGLCWFVDAVWPSVRAEFPAARFLIVGKSPNQAVKRLAGKSGVELHANVPDVRPFLARSAVAVAPMRFARGVQNKVLEAMAMEMAIVATPQSLEGLHAQSGAELMVARTPHDWQATLCALFNDPSQVRKLGSAARRYVEKNHCWDDCLQPIEEQLKLRPRLNSEPDPNYATLTACPGSASGIAT